MEWWICLSVAIVMTAWPAILLLRAFFSVIKKQAYDAGYERGHSKGKREILEEAEKVGVGEWNLEGCYGMEFKWHRQTTPVDHIRHVIGILEEELKCEEQLQGEES